MIGAVKKVLYFWAHENENWDIGIGIYRIYVRYRIANRIRVTHILVLYVIKIKKMEYDKTKFTAWTWKHWTMIHWILNPGLVINELILGQRVPKVLLFDKTSDKPLMKRQFVLCPHCGQMNSGTLWTKKNGFKNWFGYYCPNCGNTIPCLRNLTSLIVIILTFPIWIWFVKRWKKNWLNKQPARFENSNIEEIAYESTSWIKMGIIFSGIMFILMTIIIPLLEGKEITLKMILTGILIWTLAGQGFSYFMKYWMARRTKTETK